MGRFIDLSGKRFASLTVLGVAHKAAPGQYFWRCICYCGNESLVAGMHLRSGNTTSCGCRQRALFGRKHGMRHSATYSGWLAMHQRCTNQKNIGWKYYGAQGITVCKRWKSFENFLSDMGERPAGKTLDRVDPNGNYEPDNCRWATHREQMNNTRRRRRK